MTLPQTPAAAPRQGFGTTDLGLVLMSLIWGVNYSVVKAGLRTLSPLTFNGLRVSMAAIVLFAIAACVRDKLPSRRDIITLALLGLIGNGLYQLFFIFGMSRTRAGVAALVVAAGPAWIAIISRMLGREHLPLRGWSGIGLQLLGVACVVGSAQGFEGGRDVMLGAGLIALGSIAWATFSVLLQPYTKTAHPLHLSAITMASGALVLVSIALPDLIKLDWGAVSLVEWGAVTYAGIGALVVAYLLFYRGVRVLGATRTAMYGNLQPIVAIAFAWLMLGEQPTVWQILGAALIMAGLLLSRTAHARPLAERAASVSSSVQTS
ncbi:DMT family transporter [Gemmatimonas sp.]|uniref:DMT family transporter n=1 Tax=Gemmatimonas sp. TaxID=1962908 RepID=UPI00286ACAB1|nr:DMT family transporter [Gemmatimonas sp.]